MTVESILQEGKKKEERLKEKVKKAPKLTKKQQQIQEIARETVMPDYYHMVWTEEQLDEMCKWMESEEYIAIDTETRGKRPFRDEIVGFSVYAPERGYYVPLEHIDDVLDNVPPTGVVGRDYVKCLPKKLVSSKVKDILENKKLILHNAKFDMHVMYNWLGIKISPYFDTSIAAVLLDENKSGCRGYGLKELSTYYLKIPASRFSTLFGKELFNTVPILMNEERAGCLAGYYAIKDTELTFKLFKFFEKHLNSTSLKQIKWIFDNIEMPIIEDVFWAEQQGVALDSGYLLKEVAPKLYGELGICHMCKGFLIPPWAGKDDIPKPSGKFQYCTCSKSTYVEGIIQKIWKRTGIINLNSTDQLGDALYRKLCFPIVEGKKKKPKIGKNGKPTKVSEFSTAKKILAKVRKRLKDAGREEDADLIDLLNTFRAEHKLANDFADTLPNSVINGRIHTSFNTAGTVTTRFSCREPNMQQLPSRVGGLIRNAFLADNGRVLASLDYSGQELRVLSNESKCPVLLEVFRKGEDVHTKTAVGLYNGEASEPITYEYAQYCRSLQDLFLDKDGDIDESKLSEENVSNLFKEGHIKTEDNSQLLEQVKLGKKIEKIRKEKAKAVNFGRHNYAEVKPHSQRGKLHSCGEMESIPC